MTPFRLLVAVVFVVSASVLPAERVEDLPKPTDYVSDYAHVLSPEAVARLDRICSQLDHTAANAQVAIVTVRTLEGEDAADYASQLEDKWHMGKKGSDRGVLLLLAVNDHKRRIDVGYGLEGILPDGKLGDIGREMVPYLRANDFDDAVTTAVRRDRARSLRPTPRLRCRMRIRAGRLPHAGRRPARHGFSLGRHHLHPDHPAVLRRLPVSRVPVRVESAQRRIPAGLIGGGGWGGGVDSAEAAVEAEAAAGFGGFGGGDFGGGGAGGDW